MTRLLPLSGSPVPVSPEALPPSPAQVLQGRHRPTDPDEGAHSGRRARAADTGGMGGAEATRGDKHACQTGRERREGAVGSGLSVRCFITVDTFCIFPTSREKENAGETEEDRATKPPD